MSTEKNKTLKKKNEKELTIHIITTPEDRARIDAHQSKSFFKTRAPFVRLLINEALDARDLKDRQAAQSQ